MNSRFGEYAEDMEQAYISSGRILPLITTAHFPEHPSMHYWPELYGSAALFAGNNYEPWFTSAGSPRKKDSSYASADPSDEALFCSITDYVDGELGNRPRPRCYCPLGIGDWYYALHAQTMDAVARLERNTENKEIKARVVDFTMLGNLALYHAYMVQAAYHLSMYDKTNDKKFLTPSYEAMYQAREAFAVISDLGERYYARNLEFDSGDSTKRNGNWRDRLVNQVDRDLQDMESLLMKNGICPCLYRPDSGKV